MDVSTKDVTGDHAIDAITRNQKQRGFLESLSKQARGMLDINVRKYDGRSSTEAEQWLKDIGEWLRIEEQSLINAFDVLLVDEAAVLWTSFRNKDTTEVIAKTWFNDTFTIKKTITNKIVELSQVQQDTDERFATFEIRVRNMVKGIFSSGMSEEDIVRDIISHRVRDDRVKEILMTKTEMNVEEARGMAKVYENIEMSKTETRAVNIIKKTTYAQVTNRGNNQDKYNDNQVQRLQSINDSPRRNEQIRRPPISTSNDRFNYQEQRKLPTVSLKYIARKLYNDSRGIDTKAAEKLTTVQCFCCGERAHRRFECPSKDKCLI